MEQEERNKKEMFGRQKKIIENSHIIPDSGFELLPIPRPCIVKERKAVFHKWAEKQAIVIQKRIFSNDAVIEDALLSIREGYIPPEFDAYTRRKTVAIIEYEDGTVDEVAPRDIKFTEPCYCEGMLHIKN